MMSTELAITTRTLIPDQQAINTISYMAKQAANSKFYANLGGESGIIAIMLLARELDISPMQALSGGIWNIQGKVEMSARMMNMKIRQAGHKLKIDSGASSCSITGIRKDTGEELSLTYTLEDAARAGLTGRDTWKKFPREMLFNRCLSLVARMLFPDVIGNCYVEGEIRESIEVQEEEKRKIKSQESEIEEIPSEEIKPKKVISLEEESISEEEIQALKNLLGNDTERISRLMRFYEVSDLCFLTRGQYNSAMSIVNSKR